MEELKLTMMATKSMTEIEEGWKCNLSQNPSIKEGFSLSLFVEDDKDGDPRLYLSVSDDEEETVDVYEFDHLINHSAIDSELYVRVRDIISGNGIFGSIQESIYNSLLVTEEGISLDVSVIMTGKEQMTEFHVKINYFETSFEISFEEAKKFIKWEEDDF